MILQPDQFLSLQHVPNNHIAETVGVSISASDGTSMMEVEGGVEARTDLDSHANMCVIGRYSVIVSNSGRHAEVNAFSPTIESLHKVPIVDAAIAYDCPYSMKTYILIARNALYVESMDNNLVPPFIMRESGLEVNEVPKIHASEPSVENHSIYCPEQSL